MKKLLVIAAHPDDETLGCGGTITQAVVAGQDVHVHVCSEGAPGRQQGSPMLQNAMAVLGVDHVTRFFWTDQRFEQYARAELIDQMRVLIDDVHPQIVLSHSDQDANLDHRVVADAVRVASRPTQLGVEELLAFPVASSSEWGTPGRFLVDTWVPLSEMALARKVEAMRCYETEVHAFPHPRSLENLVTMARFYGAQVLVPAAEPFRTLWRRVRW